MRLGMGDGVEAGLQFIKFPPERIEKYKKAGYRFVGRERHAAVEICRWTKSRLRGGRNCYKSIYGIDSKRCIQMTPSLDLCNFACPWCWRPFGPDRHKAHGVKWDEPSVIVEEMIKAQRILLSGFGGNTKVSREDFRQAMSPAHVAISLDGEPTLYPKIAELIREINSRGMTSFLVTNGTLPHRLRDLLEKNAIPTNLYISVYATNRSDYQSFTNSVTPEAFDRVLESLRLLREFNKRGCRTVFRMTLVKGLNMKDSEGYASLIRDSEPHFFEAKGYAWLGESRERLPHSASPRFAELERFASEIAGMTGYIVKMRDKVSNIIVAVRDEETWRWNVRIAQRVAHLPGVPWK